MPLRHGLMVGVACIVAVVVPARSATAQGPSCDGPGKALATACADSTLATYIDALRVAYDIAGARSRAGDAAWRHEMQSCGDDRRCLAVSIASRQRVVNMARLEPEAPVAPVARRQVATGPAYAPEMPEESVAPLARAGRTQPGPADQAPEVAQTQPTWYYPSSPTVQPAASTAAPATTQMPEAAADTGSMSTARIMGAILIALGAPSVIAVFLLYGREESRTPGRCPRCHKRTLVLEAVHDENASFLRRRGRGRRSHEISADHVRRRCPCGYASDARDEERVT